MTSVAVRSKVAALLLTALSYPGHSADVVRGQGQSSVEASSVLELRETIRIVGRTSVIDGRTLWFPNGGHKVLLASIDACELPQWSYDPRRHGGSEIPKPVPCGPLAKAWLKRTVGSAQVTCIVRNHDADGALLGHCSARGRDLALEMVRVGWARVTTPAPVGYLTWQNYAVSARHGMWATYVLDMPEWRRKAVDRTLARRPIADFNLLTERESEISPPFADARRRPKRTDR
ncbi:thermonuclease family protein [Aminobacter sp. MDW-2]|uniref:thermonuclease family protein n=1 Tax=Aminobacter sp. MDW-2 TaxID=2666139 RepID=UPI0012B0DC5C|nr:thermonuclease family protein [Aminobacter sp. MDW-2]MRX36879.1 thermonuclease family protein [Aminobacter sp. MDW-2]QNH37905.1 thermonuclease family protein [Aminobacter sp. MDW-2]